MHGEQKPFAEEPRGAARKFGKLGRTRNGKAADRNGNKINPRRIRLSAFSLVRTSEFALQAHDRRDAESLEFNEMRKAWLRGAKKVSRKSFRIQNSGKGDFFCVKDGIGSCV